MAKKDHFTGVVLLVFVALIWGLSIVAQRLGSALLPPITFTAVRCLIGGVSMLPFLFILSPKDPRKEEYRKKPLLRAGIWGGVLMVLTSIFQQIGLETTSAGKAGFICTLYIIFIPLIGLFFKKKVAPLTWAAIGIAAVGLYLMSVTESFTIQRGDLFTLLCAFFAAVSIIVLAHFAPLCDTFKYVCLQLFVAGGLSLVLAFILEKPSVSAILACWAPLLYVGMFSSGLAFVLQVLAQKRTEPVVASLVMCLESVFSVFFGWLILRETLTERELTGCAFVLCAMVLAQLPHGIFKRKRKVKGEKF